MWLLGLACECIYVRHVQLRAPLTWKLRASLVCCGIYYYFWVSLIPKVRGYRIRQVVINVDDGAAQTHQLLKVPVEELAEWDATHDAVGRILGGRGGSRDGAPGV